MMKAKLIVLLGVLLVSVTSCVAEPESTAIDVTKAEVKELLLVKKGDPRILPVVIDVRTEKEYTEAHIEGAVNIDIRSDHFESEVIKLSKEREYIIHKLGFAKVYHYAGGFDDWLKE